MIKLMFFMTVIMILAYLFLELIENICIAYETAMIFKRKNKEKKSKE